MDYLAAESGRTDPPGQGPVNTTTTTLDSRDDSDAGWYFGFGANMAASVFLERRKIRPLRTEAACIPTHALCFNVLGIPYAEPGNGGLRELPAESKDPKAMVHGVAYLLTSEDLKRLVVIEGGGIAYYVATLDAKLLSDETCIKVNTLMARHNVSAQKERLPSQRYMGVLTRGAAEQNLPDWYQLRLAKQATYQPQNSAWYKLGAWLFLGPWVRIGIWTEKAVHRFQGPDGNVPGWFLFLFDCLLWLMWAQHDYLFGPVFGRGDGR